VREIKLIAEEDCASRRIIVVTIRPNQVPGRQQLVLHLHKRELRPFIALLYNCGSEEADHSPSPLRGCRIRAI
jgi:hypothetical protein